VTYEILRWAPVAVVLLFIAGVFLWFWLDERRFAAQVDRRFAPYKVEPRLTPTQEEVIRTQPWTKPIIDPVGAIRDLEQRVTALEEGQEDLERGAHSLILTHIKAWHSLSPPTVTSSAPTLGPARKR